MFFHCFYYVKGSNLGRHGTKLTYICREVVVFVLSQFFSLVVNHLNLASTGNPLTHSLTHSFRCRCIFQYLYCSPDGYFGREHTSVDVHVSLHGNRWVSVSVREVPRVPATPRSYCGYTNSCGDICRLNCRVYIQRILTGTYYFLIHSLTHSFTLLLTHAHTPLLPRALTHCFSCLRLPLFLLIMRSTCKCSVYFAIYFSSRCVTWTTHSLKLRFTSTLCLLLEVLSSIHTYSLAYLLTRLLACSLTCLIRNVSGADCLLEIEE